MYYYYYYVWAIIWLWRDRTSWTCSIAVSFVLKSEVDMLKMWVHKRIRAENNPTNHYQKQILITCNDHPSFWMQFQCVMFNNKALIHLNYQWQYSLQSPIAITKTFKKRDMTLSSSMAVNSVMCDIHDARRVPMERGWVALYLQYSQKRNAPTKFSCN